MQRKPHAKVAKAAKQMAAEQTFSYFFGGLFFLGESLFGLCVLGGLCVRLLGFE